MGGSVIDKTALIGKIKQLEGLTDEEKSNLIGLLRQHKKYGLVWEDKPEDVEERLRDELPVLTEVKDLALISDQPEAPNHILIEGDNLEALTALSYTHEGCIDVIYIDPPYNTGNKDFVYNDSYVDTEDSYRHSKWLSFMSKRLRIAKRLLSDKGVIFISIDDNEQANLKLLCDEVFGEYNCRNILNTRRLDKNLSQQFISKGIKSLAIGCEYVMVYSKTSEVDFYPIMREASDKRKEEGYWKGFWNAADRPTMRYELLGVKPETGQWKWEEKKALQAVENYENYQKALIDNPLLSLEEYWKMTGRCLKFIRRKKQNAKGKNLGVEHWVEPTEGILRTSNWSDIITTESHLNMDVDFSSPKSLNLIKEILRFGNKFNTFTILDFFAGSGTTLHATMQLNAIDKGHRQCILVTNNENGICENVTYKRNKQVILGYTTPKGQQIEGLHNNNLRYYRTEFISRDRTQRNMRALTAAATDLLCIKEDLYDEQTTFGRFKLKPNLARYFNDGTRHMLIIYHEELVDEVVEEIKRLKQEGQWPKAMLTIYIFSPGRYAFDDNFFEVQDSVQLVALPAAIYDAYQRVLPKRKEKLLDETKTKASASEVDELLDLGFEEGGEQ